MNPWKARVMRPPQQQSASEPGTHTDEAARDDEPHDVTRVRADGLSNTDLPGALGDRERHETVDADRCEHCRHGADVSW